MRPYVTLLVFSALAAPARGALPVCTEPPLNAVIYVSDVAYTSTDLGLGLHVSGTAEADATAVRVRLNGASAGEVSLPERTRSQTWELTLAAEAIESAPDGPLELAAQVVRADGSLSDASVTVVDKNVLPPAPVPRLVAFDRGERGIALSWDRPPDPDFARVRVLRSTRAFAEDPWDLDDQWLVYEGRGTSHLDVPEGTGPWFWTAFAFDEAGNASPRTLATRQVETAAAPLEARASSTGCSSPGDVRLALASVGLWLLRRRRPKNATAHVGEDRR